MNIKSVGIYVEESIKTEWLDIKLFSAYNSYKIKCYACIRLNFMNDIKIHGCLRTDTYICMIDGS